jgi:hypothetical protein
MMPSRWNLTSLTQRALHRKAKPSSKANAAPNSAERQALRVALCLGQPTGCVWDTLLLLLLLFHRSHVFSHVRLTLSCCSDQRGDAPSTWIQGFGISMGGDKTFYRERATLVGAGEHAGESRVIYRGHNLPLHLLTNDFFITIINMDTRVLLTAVAVTYLGLFLLWSIPWWLITKYYSSCLYGSESYVEALTFAVVTQMTIGKINSHIVVQVFM